MPRLLTETQYAELRRYEEGMPRWVNGGPLDSLVRHAYIVPTAHNPNFYAITVAGAAALAAFPAHHGIAAPNPGAFA